MPSQKYQVYKDKLDHNGRIIISNDGNIGTDININTNTVDLNYSFLSYLNFIRADVIDMLKDECRRIFNIKATDDNDDYSTGQTYFISKDTKPSNMFEQLALDIFDYHMSNSTNSDSHSIQCNQSTSGAEFWVQCIHNRDDIGFHWDRDYGLEEDENICIHPHLATVTYLTALGGPTVIINKTGVINADDDISFDSTTVNSNNCDNNKLYVVSKPLIGKHIKFDGRLLHAAPSDLIHSDIDDDDNDDDDNDDEDDDDDDSDLRVTFLVNIWLNHIPTQSVRLIDRNCGDSSKSLCNDTSSISKSTINRVNISGSDDVKCKEWLFSHGNCQWKISIPVSHKAIVADIFNGDNSGIVDSIEIDCSKSNINSGNNNASHLSVDIHKVGYIVEKDEASDDDDDHSDDNKVKTNVSKKQKFSD